MLEAPETVDGGTLFRVGFGEITIHTSESFSDRTDELSQMSSELGVVFEDWSAGHPE